MDPEGGKEMRPREMNEVIGGKRYRTETATLIASDAYWDGHNYERHGRNTFLFRTPKGNYFAQYQSCWQGELDRLEPLSREEAIRLFEELQEKEMDFREAFPGVQIEEA
jgi:hypothetical protein